MKTKGIILVAAGHVNYYRMARNLAISIRANDPGVNVCIAVQDETLLEYKQEGLFDKIIILPAETYTTLGSPDYLKTKVCLYDITPYDETLFLDVDMIWLGGKTPTELMEEMKEVNFNMGNSGSTSFSSPGIPSSYWANIDDVKKAYNLTDEKWFQYHSEIIWFKKNAEVKKYFAQAKKIFNSPKIDCMRFAGGTMADELAFMIASSVLKFYPSNENWLPVFWHHKHYSRKNEQPYMLKDTFVAYSMGGNGHPSNIIANYNNLAAHYYQKLGLQNIYTWKDKKTFLIHRSKI